jgi:DNA-binding NarL/FixJ family response regulator
VDALYRLSQLGFQCGEVDEPYAAIAELAKRPLQYRSVVLSLQSLYREELQIIATIKARWPQLDVWLTHTDGRATATADALRFGADGLLTEEGLQRTVMGSAARSMEPKTSSAEPPTNLPNQASDFSDEESSSETVLSADELRALLQEPPAPLPRHTD